LNDESLSNIDVNVEAMEQVTFETETASEMVEMDAEVAIATKLLGEDFMTPGPQASIPKSQGVESGTIRQLMCKMRFIVNSPDTPVNSHPFNIAVPSVEQGRTSLPFFMVSLFLIYIPLAHW
jgi:hypothetical protein